MDNYQENFGKPISIKQIQKQINNMKPRLENQTDLNRTGNKPIKLNSRDKYCWIFWRENLIQLNQSSRIITNPYS